MKKDAKTSELTTVAAPSVPAIGRPSLYTPELARQILERVANGERLRDICRDEGMPPARTVRGWALDDLGGFAADYLRARRVAWEEIADDILEIADDTRGDFTTDKDGKIVPDYENVQRSKLKVDARKWLLSKMLPRQFGDRVELSGPDGAPVVAPVFNIAFVRPAIDG